MNWLPRRFKWTRPFRRKTKCGFCACAIRFRTSSTSVQLKQYLYTPGQAQRVPGIQVPRFYDNQHIKVVRLSAIWIGRLYPKEIFMVLISVRGWVETRAILRAEGLCKWKIPMPQSWIEPAASRIVAQRLNQQRHGVPQKVLLYLLYD